ncbi:MAG: hypothetical protein ACRYGK_03280, partial [Janthinobacterium lividum]
MLGKLAGCDTALAAYALARVLDGRPVGSEEFDLLRYANASRITSKSYFDGRCNVRTDRTIGKSGTNAWRMKSAVNIVLKQVGESGITGLKITPAVLAGVLACYRSGACTEQALVSAFVCARKIASDEIVILRRNELQDHCWVVIKNIKANLSVVCDPWCDGPAIATEDSRYELAQGSITDLVITAENASREVLGLQAKLSESGVESLTADNCR